MSVVQITCAAISLSSMAIGLVGCSPSGNERRAEVAGEVTLDGEPVPQRTITFFPTAENTGPATGGTIQDGHYSIPRADGPVVGKNRIQISAFRKTGRKVPSARNPDNMEDELVESVPPQYNAESTLIQDIQPGKNVLELRLQSY